MKPENQYLINGRKDTSLSPYDRGFAYGDGVFRTLKVNQGAPQHWKLQYQKLLEDCNALNIVCPSAEVLQSDMQVLLNDLESAIIKIVVTRGESERGYALPPLAQPTRVVIKSAVPTYPESNYSDGVSLHLCQIRLSEQPLLAGVKHLNRLENVLARSEWSNSTFADGVVMDANDNVIECTMSNIFAKFDDLLITPDLSRSGVAGITRQRIIDLANKIGLTTRVAVLPLKELMQADEFIICNSLFGAWQVNSFNQKTWPSGNLAKDLRNYLMG